MQVSSEATRKVDVVKNLEQKSTSKIVTLSSHEIITGSRKQFTNYCFPRTLPCSPGGTWPLGRNHVTITQIRAQTKKFFKSIQNSHISLSFLLIWKRSYTLVVPSKTIPDSRPKWAKCTPVFRPKRRKNPTRWGGTYPGPCSYRLYKTTNK